MRTTIDAAGRIVVPKAMRDSMGLTAGRAIDVVFTDGLIQIELAPVEVDLDTESGPPRLVPRSDDLPSLSDDDVRDVLEATRR
ncbi:AbrB/MazE/SpoVT family DNA-binding domain-containing protein [Knoellia subterranea]|uniref:Antitoxin n=1 Tax=Knoellia subterranea KCTC 19937 TaxID=1385521 RepID=A0A0A0JLD3_9MICO|nr:AbrB/MazE/SpoVT family DNA-binding domain-containing protein [Knoellia subterranea]KGN38265.1 antitoxin [Knoellia subterranea KCTC 19937]